MIALRFDYGLELHMALWELSLGWELHSYPSYETAYQQWIEMPWDRLPRTSARPKAA